MNLLRQRKLDKKILITGCSGYLGTQCTKILSNLNYIIDGIDITKPKDISLYNRFYLQDISNFISDTEYDCVIHLAALVKVNESLIKSTEYYNTNLFGTFNLLENIKTNNFIFSSTGVSTYLNNPYSISKAASEFIIKEYCSRNKINFTIFRISNILGGTPTNDQGLMYHLLNALNTKVFTIYGNNYNTIDGTCVRDYIHINEVCNAMSLAINAPSNSTEELGHGVGYSVKEIVNIFKTVNNVEFDIKYENSRTGDLACTIAKNPSKFLNKTYNIEQILKVM